MCDQTQISVKYTYSHVHSSSMGKKWVWLAKSPIWNSVDAKLLGIKRQMKLEINQVELWRLNHQWVDMVISLKLRPQLSWNYQGVQQHSRQHSPQGNCVSKFCRLLSPIKHIPRGCIWFLARFEVSHLGAHACNIIHKRIKGYKLICYY